MVSLMLAHESITGMTYQTAHYNLGLAASRTRSSFLDASYRSRYHTASSTWSTTTSASSARTASAAGGKDFVQGLVKFSRHLEVGVGVIR
jgi:hypothetical protein